MVFLKTDTGEFRELLVPSIVSIGRGNSNDIRPQNQSVSKQHAQITLSNIPGTGKVEAWLEDLNSSYGTYAGETPLEIERVQGKIKLYFGFYMRFGHAPNYFQYLENIPANAEVIRPEIIVSPSKDFQKKVHEFSQNQHQQQPQRSHDEFSQPQSTVQPPQQVQAFSSFQQSPQPHFNKHQSSLSGFNNNSDNNIDMSAFSNSGRLDSSLNIAPPASFEAANRSSRPSTGKRGHSSGYYDSNEEDDNPRNMQISVNYPTSNRHSPQHPVTIRIDGTGAEGGGYSDRPRSGGAAGNRYSTSPDGHSPGRNMSFDFDRAPDYSDRAHPGRSQSLLPENTSTNRVNWLDESYGVGGHGTLDRVAFEESYGKEELDSPPRSQSYNRSGSIQAQHKSILSGNYNNVSTSYNSNNEVKSSSSAVGRQGKPKTVSENMRELSTLSKRAIGQQSNRIGRSTASDEDGAMHSRYYQNQQNLRGSGGTQPRGILKASKQADFQTRVADSGAIMDAVVPSKAELVRRSWPDELLLPSSELIAGFVDLLLAQETGTTEKEYALYKDIYIGKAKDKNAKVTLPVDQDGQLDSAGLSRAPILSFLKMNPVKCELPIVLPDAVMSEAVAETILDSDSTATGLIGSTIRELNNLLRQCLLGTQIDGSVLETSVDFDHALQGVITSILKHASAQLLCAQQSNVIVALESARAKGGLDIRTNVGLLIQQSIDSLARINSLMSGAYLKEETCMLGPNHIYEMVALALSGILNKLDACNVSVWSISQRADEVTIEHVVNKSAGFLKASLSLELEELRKLKKDSDLTPLVDRIRQQETNILERKILRFHKVFEIILDFNMRSAFHEWRANARSLKRQEIALLDLSDRCATTTKRQFFKVWMKNYRTTHAFKKTLRRFGRIMGWKGHSQVRKYLHRWRSMVERSKQYNESGVEIARLRSELCNMKATLHDLTNKDEIAASLAAERALNRELSSMNQELRLSMQQLQEKILEVGTAPSGKRKDLVYHYLLGKEEELAESRRENKFLHSELDHLRILAARRLQPAPKGRALPPPPTARPAAQGGGYKPVSLLRDDGPWVQSTVGVRSGGAGGENNTRSQIPSMLGHHPTPVTSSGRAPMKYDPSRNKPIVDKPNTVAYMMNKDEAKVVILSEVRRLRESHTILQDSRNQLNNKMIEETNRNVQLTMATQALQVRLTAMQRSAGALRELLRQKFGDQGVVHMMEALENLGAGSNALLEVPVSGTAEVVAAEVVDRTPYSYESKHPESPQQAPGRRGSGDLGPGSYYMQALTPPGSSEESVQEAARAAQRSLFAGKSGGGSSAAAADSENPYSRAIENAMYGKK